MRNFQVIKLFVKVSFKDLSSVVEINLYIHHFQNLNSANIMFTRKPKRSQEDIK